jgi:hypothetical protein
LVFQVSYYLALGFRGLKGRGMREERIGGREWEGQER